MCGLTGGWSQQRFAVLRDALPIMGEALHHRGPDDGGKWWDADAGIALAHRRLAIVDISPAGHQPMQSASNRWVIVYNGEIYNHCDLRRELESEKVSPVWRGHSDTETLLAAIEAWGVEETLRRSVGMFAFALWDRKERCLWLARDRMGEKPLYYGWHRGVFLFGSELKALRSLPIFDPTVDRRALALYLRHNAIPAPYSIYEGIHKLLPGHWLRLNLRQLEAGEQPTPQPFWLAAEAVTHGHARPFSGSEADAADALEELLRDAVAGQMVADVPLGAFLSGGIDSSTVVALMQAQSAQPVRTFSIGFHEAEFNEASHAAAVARHLGTDHTELYVSPQEAMAVVPDLPLIYDEPFADSSQIPTSLVSRLAGSHVNVALSGDGGDELFGGYSRYFIAARLWGRISSIPRKLRQLAGGTIASIPIPRLDRLYGLVEPLIPTDRRWNLPGDKIHKGATVLALRDGRAMYRELCSHWSPSDLLLGIEEPTLFGPSRGEPLADLTEYMMLEDSCHYMADDILAKVDRAAMSCSLETRVPLLDHRVFEFAWQLPMDYKVRGGDGKRVLRQVLNRYVPKELVDRPKMGFGIPLASWLCGPLKDWAGELLDPARLRREGFFAPEPIGRKWQEHQSGVRNWQYHLWDVLMFQAWLERQ